MYIDPKTQRRYYRRLDYPDLVFKTRAAKFKAVVDEIATVYKTGRPILVGTIAIETSEMLSQMLPSQRRTASGVERQTARA